MWQANRNKLTTDIMPKHSYNKKSIRKHGTTAWKAEFDEENKG